MTKVLDANETFEALTADLQQDFELANNLNTASIYELDQNIDSSVCHDGCNGDHHEHLDRDHSHEGRAHGSEIYCSEGHKGCTDSHMHESMISHGEKEKQQEAKVSCAAHGEGCSGNHHEQTDHGEKTAEAITSCRLGHEGCTSSHHEHEHAEHVDRGEAKKQPVEATTTRHLGHEGCTDSHKHAEHVDTSSEQTTEADYAQEEAALRNLQEETNRETHASEQSVAENGNAKATDVQQSTELTTNDLREAEQVHQLEQAMKVQANEAPSESTPLTTEAPATEKSADQSAATTTLKNEVKQAATILDQESPQQVEQRETISQEDALAAPEKNASLKAQVLVEAAEIEVDSTAIPDAVAIQPQEIIEASTATEATKVIDEIAEAATQGAQEIPPAHYSDAELGAASTAEATTDNSIEASSEEITDNISEQAADQEEQPAARNPLEGLAIENGAQDMTITAEEILMTEIKVAGTEDMQALEEGIIHLLSNEVKAMSLDSETSIPVTETLSTKVSPGIEAAQSQINTVLATDIEPKTASKEIAATVADVLVSQSTEDVQLPSQATQRVDLITAKLQQQEAVHARKPQESTAMYRELITTLYELGIELPENAPQEDPHFGHTFLAQVQTALREIEQNTYLEQSLSSCWVQPVNFTATQAMLRIGKLALARIKLITPEQLHFQPRST